MATIHQRLRDARGLAVSVASFRGYVAANLPEETRRSQVKVLRPWPAGKLMTVWAFVMVLACSRHMFVRPVIRLDQQGWSECHVAAFGSSAGSRAGRALRVLVDPARAYRPATSPGKAHRPLDTEGSQKRPSTTRWVICTAAHKSPRYGVIQHGHRGDQAAEQ